MTLHIRSRVRYEAGIAPCPGNRKLLSNRIGCGDSLALAVARTTQLSDDRIEGSLVIDGIDAQGAGAHLRWFIVSDALRGTGWGNKLMRTALDSCRERGYATIFLDTVAGLDAARHLYEKFGFRMVSQQQGERWGAEAIEQRFECHL